VASMAGSTFVMASPSFAQNTANPGSGTWSGVRNSAPFGARIQGVQHFGVTVQNMDQTFEFYSEVLGGTEVIRDGDFQGERIHNTLLLNEDIAAKREKINPRTIRVPDLRGGGRPGELLGNNLRYARQPG